MNLTTTDLKRYQGKTVPDLIRIATKYYNRFIRERDAEDWGFICISCGKANTLDQMNCGHFHSAGHYPAVRFDEMNTWGQCVRCNLYLSGNLIGYYKGLLAKIGQEEIDALEVRAKRRGFKWQREALIETILTYQKKCKQ